METEEFIIGQLLFYPEFHHSLPKIKPQWFTNQTNRKVINAMTAIYLENNPVDILRLSKALKKDEMLYTLRIQQKVSTKSPIAPYLLELEYEYLRTNLIERLAGLNLNKDLQGLTTILE